MFFERSLKIHKMFEVVPYFQKLMGFHKIFSGSLRFSVRATGGHLQRFVTARFGAHHGHAQRHATCHTRGLRGDLRRSGGAWGYRYFNILYWLLVDLPLWKIWKSVGMMTFPIYGKIKNVPNHQPVMHYLVICYWRCFVLLLLFNMVFVVMLIVIVILI